ncbi:MAG: Ig-like domain-containing protein [Clostridia bacterium]|nr:Ig-like domain-containing protein [Clostridia bacterium]
MTMIHSVTTSSIFGTSTTYTTGVLSDNVIGKPGYDTTTGSLNHIAAPSTDYTTLYPTAEIAYTSAQTAVDNLFSYYVVVTDKNAFSISYEGVVNYKSFLNGAANGDTVGEPFSGTLSFAGVEEEDPEVPATAIAINGDDVVVANVGATGTLTATVTPDTTTDTIAWESSNDACVTIDAATGAWSAVKPGKATITVTAGSVSDTVVIKVKPSTLVGSKFEYMNGIVWAGNSITGAAFGKNFKATFTDGVNTVTQSISGAALETEGTMTFDAVLKVYNDVADAGITMSLSCDAAE